MEILASIIGGAISAVIAVMVALFAVRRDDARADRESRRQYAFASAEKLGDLLTEAIHGFEQAALADDMDAARRTAMDVRRRLLARMPAFTHARMGTFAAAINESFVRFLQNQYARNGYLTTRLRMFDMLMEVGDTPDGREGAGFGPDATRETIRAEVAGALGVAADDFNVFLTAQLAILSQHDGTIELNGFEPFRPAPLGAATAGRLVPNPR
jgi:hypothetical protein